ncbi:MAG: CvpA family protein [Rhodocyclaceae bacterium]|nr:CvpA family protein [Rhodocyclaceae bacterium]
MAAFDWAVLAVAGLSLLLGLWRGVVSEILSLAAWVAAFLAASNFAGLLALRLTGAFGDKSVAQVAGFVIIFVAVLVAFALVRFLAKRLLAAIGLGPLDRLLGAVFGLVRAAVVLVVLVMLGGLTSLPREPWWSEANLSPPLETAVLAVKPHLPQALAKKIRFK